MRKGPRSRFQEPAARCFIRLPPRSVGQRCCRAISPTNTVEALVPDAEKTLGPLDILVANAGITKDNLFIALKDEDWDQVLNVNLTSTFRLARAAVKGMMRRRFGRVIGITSVVGVTGNPGQANYTAAKAGMIGMFKSIGKEYAKRGVRPQIAWRPEFICNADDRQAQRQASARRFCRWCRRGNSAPAPMSPRQWFIWPPMRPLMSPARHCT